MAIMCGSFNSITDDVQNVMAYDLIRLAMRGRAREKLFN